mmetsp:Transcript_18149/g.37416  ORF Transcript_18149/g.37416 Transcript_18149/m.37416 type:complete len:83 (-) Transcript_18149:410-658(-)
MKLLFEWYLINVISCVHQYERDILYNLVSKIQFCICESRAVPILCRIFQTSMVEMGQQSSQVLDKNRKKCHPSQHVRSNLPH